MALEAGQPSWQLLLDLVRRLREVSCMPVSSLVSGHVLRWGVVRFFYVGGLGNRTCEPVRLDSGTQRTTRTVLVAPQRFTLVRA